MTSACGFALRTRAAMWTASTRRRAGRRFSRSSRTSSAAFDLRDSDGKLVRCEKTASGETECRVVQEGRRQRAAPALIPAESEHARALLGKLTGEGVLPAGVLVREHRD